MKELNKLIRGHFNIRYSYVLQKTSQHLRNIAKLLDGLDYNIKEEIIYDIDTNISDIIESSIVSFSEYIIPNYVDYIKELNLMSDEDIINQLDKEKEIYELLFNPSERVREYYIFKYRL